MIKTLHEIGVKSEYAYLAGFASIWLNWLTYAANRARSKPSREEADAWGIFVATWAPTMFALGTALRMEEGKRRRRRRRRARRRLIRS